MSITDSKIHKAASVARKYLQVGPATLGASVAGLPLGKIRIPVGFEVVSVHAWAQALTGTVSVDVKVGNGGTDTSVLASVLTPTAGSTDPAAATLAATIPPRRGTAGQVVTVYGTTASSSSATLLTVTVVIRPYPLNGES